MRTKKFFVIVLALSLVLTLGAAMVQAQDMEVIRIASQSPLSGPQSVLGISIRNSVELAIEQLQEPLNELGYTVEFIPFDDEATSDVGVANANNIVNDAAILAIIGHLNSGVALPSSEVYNDNDLAMVSPANTNINITDRGYLTVNRICGRDDTQGAAGAAFAATLEGVETVYVLHDTTAYGQGVAEFFQIEAEAQGLEVLGFEGTEEASNFDGILQPILSQEPDLIYFGGIYSQTGIFISQARSAGYEGFFVGPDGFDSSEFAKLAGDAGVGTYYTSVAAPVTVYEAAEQFALDYEEKFGEGVQPFGAQAYDSTAIALAGIAAAIEANGGELPTRAQVAEAIRATEEFEGLAGSVTFDENGDPELANYYILQVVSADDAEWNSNEVLSTQAIPSPLMAAAMSS
ncbi:MAG: branched-chain amino acid ABC transporter substrate-binding protein [Chloroflexota bacterium]|nr:branched-chain amino acid ABC transporter substrate-binding protein [Chloroflexota bacterium]